MGPVIVFDKSALQALSMDESVWLDAFFSTNVVPLLYVETLADLSQNMREGRSPEELVGMLATKTPDDAFPNVHHRELILAELAGYPVPMTSRVIIGEGDTREQPNGKRGVHIGVTPESEALTRWQKRDFQEVERRLARNWRARLEGQDNSFVAEALAPLLSDHIVSDLAGLKAFVDEFCASVDAHVLTLLLEVVAAPTKYAAEARRRWEAAGRPPIDQFVPYAVHVFKVQLVFYLGVHRGFISGVRASNQVDMAYLYYLPFAKVFASGDGLHRRTAPLFLGPAQRFVTSVDLKAALAEVNEHYLQLPEEVKERGTKAFAPWPPSEIDNIVTQLWDQHMRPDWRELARIAESRIGEPFDGSREAVAELKEQLSSAQPAADGSPNDDPDYVLIERQVQATKGSWRILPQKAVHPCSTDTRGNTAGRNEPA